MKDVPKEVVVSEIIRMFYDIISEVVKGSKDEEHFYEVFTDEAARSEIESLSEYGFHFEKSEHPFSAINMYRYAMVNANSYIFVDEVSPVLDGKDGIKMNFRRCPYRDICASYKETNFCIRGWAYVYMINNYSQGKSKMLRRNYDPLGNCSTDIKVEFKTLENIPDDDGKNVNLYRVLTREQYLDIVLESWLEAIEASAIKVFGKEGGRAFLKKVHEKLVDKWIEKFFKIDYYIGYPLYLWKNGELLFGNEIDI